MSPTRMPFSLPQVQARDRVEARPQPWGREPLRRPYGLDKGLGPAPGSVPVSVAILTRNAEADLGACLASVAFAAEVVVVDAQSTDHSVSLATAAGAQVYVRPGQNPSAQGNFSLAQCSHDWVLTLEADERASLGLAEEIAGLLKRGPEFPAYRVARRNLYLGRWLSHGGAYPAYRVRLFDRRNHAYPKDAGTVRLDVEAPSAGSLGAPLLRPDGADFRTVLESIGPQAQAQAHELRAAGARARPRDFVLRPAARFLGDYVLKRGFLDGAEGLLYCLQGALLALETWVKIWEQGRGQKS